MATNTGHVMNLANSIIGVSVLAMPFCFKQCGITLAILLLLLSSIITRLACHFLVKSSLMVRRRNFEFLAFYAFGSSGKLLVELGIIGFMMGTCVAFFVVMGDLGPAILSKVFEITNNSTLRSSVLVGVGFFIVLPMGLLKNVESLAAVSTVTICFYVLLVMKILSESSSHLAAGDWVNKVNFWRPEGLLQCFPIFAMALSCQTQIFEIFETIPNASLDKMNAVVRSAVHMCTVVYIAVGLLGYVAFSGANFAGNILLSFSPSFVSELYKLGFVMSLAVSFPLVIFPCRASLYSLLFKKVPVYQELGPAASSHIPDSRFKCLTLVIVTISLVTGLLIPNIELVLGFVGSTIGVAICVIFPAVAFISLTSKETNERQLAKATLVAGILIMMVGTYGNLYAASEAKPHPSIELSPGLADHAAAPKAGAKPSAGLLKHDETKDKAPKDSVDPLRDKPIQKLIEPPPAKAEPPAEPEKRKEPPVPMPPVETKRVEPPVPVAPKVEPKAKVVEPPQPPAAPAVPLPAKEPIPSTAKPKEEPPEKKPVENINRDAIEKEEREEKEAQKQRQFAEEQKKEELLKTLKEHEDEQKKLLAEQQKILREMKDRAPEEEKKDSPPKSIDSAKFSDNIAEIQSVIADLKDKKEMIEKEKVEAPKVEEALAKVEAPLAKVEEDVRPRNIALAVPLPLAKLGSVVQTKDSVQSKQEALGRDILAQKRDKRDVEGSQPQVLVGADEEKCEGKPAAEGNIISETGRLSDPQDTNLDINAVPNPKDQSPVVLTPKKRDLKSVETKR